MGLRSKKLAKYWLLISFCVLILAVGLRSAEIPRQNQAVIPTKTAVSANCLKVRTMVCP